jgi:hypothetical protein
MQKSFQQMENFASRTQSIDWDCNSELHCGKFQFAKVAMHRRESHPRKDKVPQEL